MKSMHFKALPVGHQNRQISRDFLLDIKRHTLGGKYQFFQSNAIPFSVSILRDFQKTAFYRSGLNEQNEQFSVKSADLKK